MAMVALLSITVQIYCNLSICTYPCCSLSGSSLLSKQFIEILNGFAYHVRELILTRNYDALTCSRNKAFWRRGYRSVFLTDSSPGDSRPGPPLVWVDRLILYPRVPVPPWHRHLKRSPTRPIRTRQRLVSGKSPKPLDIEDRHAMLFEVNNLILA
jgi:hypothetical protein